MQKCICILIILFILVAEYLPSIVWVITTPLGCIMMPLSARSDIVPGGAWRAALAVYGHFG